MTELVIRELGLQSYEPVWRAMQQFTDARTAETPDEIWFTEHESVFTLGLNTAPEHLLAPGDIPVIQIDRGGQVTYHGPGQLMIYPLIDLRRAGLGVRDLVTSLEQCVVDLAAEYGVAAASRCDAPRAIQPDIGRLVDHRACAGRELADADDAKQVVAIVRKNIL